MEYLGEEVGNLIDPSATTTSNKQQHAFIVAMEQAADTELGGAYDEIKGEDGPSWSALMDHEYPLDPTGVHCVTAVRVELQMKYFVVYNSSLYGVVVVAGNGPGNWGEGRMAQQAPADIEHDFAGDFISKRASRRPSQH